MIVIILITFMAICNAFMDIVENENFSSSIFKNLDQKFWYKRVSWQYAKKVFGYKIDAWHLAKSLMIILLITIIVIITTTKPDYYFKFINERWYVQFILLGMIWNGVFITFYKLFKGKSLKIN